MSYQEISIDKEEIRPGDYSKHWYVAFIQDNMFIDLNGVLYKCAKDDGALYKDILKGKQYILMTVG